MSLLIYYNTLDLDLQVNKALDLRININNGTSITLRYSNYCFTIEKSDGTVITICEYLQNKVLFINNGSSIKQINETLYAIPFYSNSLWMKVINVLYITGYKNFYLFEFKCTNPEPFYNNKVMSNSLSAICLLQLYQSYSFYRYISNTCIVNLIDDDLCLPLCYQRMNQSYCLITTSMTLYDFLFNEKYTLGAETNIRIISEYLTLIKYPEVTPEYILCSNYALIYPNKIDHTFMNTCKFKFVGKDDYVPINYEDYMFLHTYYSFDATLYRILCPDIASSDDVCMFIHFLVKENNKEIMKLPKDFKYETYMNLNTDLASFTTPRQVIEHFLLQGRVEERNIHKLPMRFDWRLYVQLNNLSFTDKYDAEYHWLTFGKKNKLLSSDMLPSTFDATDYAKKHVPLLKLTDIQLMKHYLQNHSFDTLLVDSFVPNEYIKANPDLDHLSNKSDEIIMKHFMDFGIFENRYHSVQKTSCYKKILLLCHVGNITTFKKMEQYIQNAIDSNTIYIRFDVVLNVVNTLSESDLEYIRSHFPTLDIRVNPDFGFDIGGFFLYLKKCKDGKIKYDYVIKIHTKTSDVEREKLIKPLLGSVNRIHYIVDLFNNESTGLIGSQDCMFYNHEKLAVHNFNHLSYLIKKFDLNISPQQIIQFVGGTMFWIRFSILEKIFFNYNFDTINSELNSEKTFDWNWYLCANKNIMKDLLQINNKIDAERHYDANHNQTNISGNLFHAIKYNTRSIKLRDGMIEHAYERLFSYMTEDMGYNQVFVPMESLINTLQIQPVPIVFPQFHQIPENDKFWGTGFTEWTMLNKCKKNYLGTEMMTPHKDIGQYMILDNKYITWCEQTYANYMINTVCYYHYWFNGHKVMNRPIEHIRDNNRPNVNFILAWANETWSSRWDGQETQTLIKQEYGDETSWITHIEYLLTFFEHRQYVKINNKPLFMVYRPLDMSFETFNSMMQLFNVKVKSKGFDGLYLVIFQNNCGNMSLYDQYNNCQWTNGIMDFNPNYTNTITKLSYRVHDDSVHIFEDGVYNDEIYLAYNIDVKNAINKGDVKNGLTHYNGLSKHEKKTRVYKSSIADSIACYRCIEQEPRKHNIQLYSTFMGWDNSPRRDIKKIGMKPTIFLGTSPYAFKDHLKNMINKIIRNPNQGINWLILNAWNEWNEQTCLEPSEQFSYKYIEAVRDVFGEYY